MKKLFLILLLAPIITFAQNTSGISYQALIVDKEGDKLPGFDNPNTPFANKSVCLRFSLINEQTNSTDYVETQTVTTNEFGIVNTIIGTGNPTTTVLWDEVLWGILQKRLVVAVDLTANCNSFTVISDQILNYTPYAYFSKNSKNDEQVENNKTDINQLRIDVDQNEADADAADANLQSNIDAFLSDVNNNEAAANTAIAAVQADVDQNEADADAAIAAKQDVINGGATTITSDNLSANFALLSDSNGKVAVSSVTATELSYVGGVTSAIQTQIDNLLNKITTLENDVATLQQLHFPEITLTGSTPFTHEIGDNYFDAGATANDLNDGDITSSIVTVNPVDKDTVGTYTVTYNVTDSDGNAATEVTRTVTVADTTAPEITGSENVNVNENETAVGTYSANESVTWSLSGVDSSNFSYNETSGALVFSSAPNYEVPTDDDSNNVYTLTLTATDPYGNATSVNISITVVNVVEAFDSSLFSIQATTTTETTATINWTYSGDVGAPGVEGYFLWVRIGRGGSWGPATVFNETLTNSASLTSYTLTGLTPDTMYAFRLWPIYNGGTKCNNCNGTGEPLFTTTADTTAPEITGSENVNVNENETAVGTYSANESVTWSLSGVDSSNFSYNETSGALVFSSAPNYEVPTDDDSNNVYTLTLTATDPYGNATSVNISITVVNVVEAFDSSLFSIQATTTTETTATINWTYSGDVGAPGVEGYFLWVRIGRGGSWGPATVFNETLTNSASLTSYTLTGLTPDTMYAFRLWPIYNGGTKCNNCNGTGEPLFTTTADTEASANTNTRI